MFKKNLKILAVVDNLSHKKDDPDVTLSAQESRIGGLGIFMVKKSMDHMYYEYKDGKNHISIIKKLSPV